MDRITDYSIAVQQAISPGIFIAIFRTYFANPRTVGRVVNSLPHNFLIIIDLSNQLSEAQKALEKHNKLNCDDYDAGIVQTGCWLVLGIFQSSLSSRSLRVLLWLAGDVGTLTGWCNMGKLGSAAGRRITEEMPPVTISLHSPVPGCSRAAQSLHRTSHSPLWRAREDLTEEMLLRGLT